MLLKRMSVWTLANLRNCIRQDSINYRHPHLGLRKFVYHCHCNCILRAIKYRLSHFRLIWIQQKTDELFRRINLWQFMRKRACHLISLEIYFGWNWQFDIHWIFTILSITINVWNVQTKILSIAAHS